MRTAGGSFIVGCLMDKWADQYKDPRWQKKRLEVFERAGFRCQNCGNSEKELHAHHLRYKNGAQVWNYENRHIVCLCSKCHELLHDIMNCVLEEMMCRFDIALNFEENANLFDNNEPYDTIATAMVSAMKNVHQEIPHE